MLALLLLVGGAIGLTLSCCRYRQPLPEVPVLPAAPAPIVIPPAVRVLLDQSQKGIAVECPGRGTWYGAAAAGKRVAAVGAGPWLVGVRDGRLTLDAEEQPEPELQLQGNDGRFRLGNHTYRGSLQVKVASNGSLMAFNVVEPEHYVRSVVGTEMYSNWRLDALMAQAVAARTFMLYASGARGYLAKIDMAYKGVEAESRSADLATRLTHGIILTYHDRLLPAYFHSTCGGRTVPVESVFPEDPTPPLAGTACDWCRRSRWYSWQTSIPAALIADSLKRSTVQTVRSILPETAAAGGHAGSVVINGNLRMPASAFRLAVGPDRVKSTRFSVTASGDQFLFQGRGYGHGVGMCQWGAQGLAKAGRSWQEILLYYYPGAALRKVN